jgi:DNA-3-methyladenine glycosylase I
MKPLDDVPCGWAPAKDALYRHYHDTEWGVPERDSRALWEKFQLDGFQAGLSWITILRKREEMRREFDGFEPEKLVRWSDKRIAKALTNPGIIRSPIKVAATINNARLSEAIAKDMKKRGFKFCGPTIVYAVMQAMGMVNDHEVRCPRYKEIQRLERERR